ncbi:MAG: hypothetical protein QM608_20330 [Caulobacter sp.]
MRRKGREAPVSTRWRETCSALSDRVIAEGRVDPSFVEEPFSAEELREAALDAAGHVHAIGRGGRAPPTEEYYLVLQLCRSLAIICGLDPSALTEKERAALLECLVEMLTSRRKWVAEDLATARYAAVARIWPFDALRARLTA